MDRVELRNLLRNRKLPLAVLKPLGYNRHTFEAICEVVEGAYDYEQKRGRDRLIKAVQALKKMQAGE